MRFTVLREQGRSAIDGGIGEPALGGGDETVRNLGSTALCEASDDGAIVRIPGQRGGAGGEFGVALHIEEGRQQRLRGYFVGVDQLRDFGNGDGRGFRGFAKGQGAVGSAEVDADRECGHGLLHFNFGRSQDGEVLTRAEFRKGRGGGAPAAMAESATFGLAGSRHVTDEFDERGVAGGRGDGAAFDGVNEGLRGEVAGQDFAGFGVDVAGGCADLLVGVGGDIFHEEIEDAPISLEDAEELERAIFGRDGRGRRGLRRGRRGFGGEAELRDHVVGQFAAEQEREKRAKCE